MHVALIAMLAWEAAMRFIIIRNHRIPPLARTGVVFRLFLDANSLNDLRAVRLLLLCYLHLRMEDLDVPLATILFLKQRSTELARHGSTFNMCVHVVQPITFAHKRVTTDGAFERVRRSRLVRLLDVQLHLQRVRERLFALMTLRQSFPHFFNDPPYPGG